jgi:hypothetical protein
VIPWSRSPCRNPHGRDHLVKILGRDYLRRESSRSRSPCQNTGSRLPSSGILTVVITLVGILTARQPKQQQRQPKRQQPHQLQLQLESTSVTASTASYSAARTAEPLYARRQFSRSRFSLVQPSVGSPASSWPFKPTIDLARPLQFGSSRYHEQSAGSPVSTASRCLVKPSVRSLA